MGDVLSTTLQLLASYNLRSVRELKEHKPQPGDQCRPIEHLASYDGFYCLSALTWTAQLVLFDYACFQEQDDEDQIPVFLTKICKKFFQQLAETPFGYILQWRLYLLKVGKAAIAKHQAQWLLDRQTVEYCRVELQMLQISDLVVSRSEEHRLNSSHSS